MADEDGLDFVFALAAAGPGLGGGHEFVQGVVPGGDRGPQVARIDTHTVADPQAVGPLAGVHDFIPSLGPGEQQVGAPVRQGDPRGEVEADGVSVEVLADQVGPNEFSVPDDELFVDQGPGVGIPDYLVAVGGFEDPHGDDRNVALEPGRGEVSGGVGGRLPAKHRGGGPGLFVGRGHQAPGPPFVFDALPDGEHRRVRSFQLGIDQDPLVDRQARGLGQPGVGFDPRRIEDHLGLDPAAVLEHRFFHPGAGPQELGDVGAGQKGHPLGLESFLEGPARFRGQLGLHQGLHQVAHGDPLAQGFEDQSQFEAQQPAADHHHFGFAIEVAKDFIHVSHVPEDPDPREVDPGDLGDERQTASGNHTGIVGKDPAVGQDHLFGGGVDLFGPDPQDRDDPLGPVPGFIVEKELFNVVPEKLIKEFDPVVVAHRLVADHRDLPAGVPGQDLFDDLSAGHPRPHHHQFLVHRFLPPGPSAQVRNGLPSLRGTFFDLSQSSRGNPSPRTPEAKDRDRISRGTSLTAARLRIPRAQTIR